MERIAFLCHPYHRGGVTRWMADAAMAYAERGIATYFVTVQPRQDFQAANGQETMISLLVDAKNVQIIQQSAGWEFEFGTQEYRTWVYSILLGRLPTGVPVILSDDPAVWAASSALRHRNQMVGVLHADSDQYYNLAVAYAASAAVYTCVSQRVRKLALQQMPGFPPERVFTIPCGISLPVLPVSLPDFSGLRLVYVGRIRDYQKRVGDLVGICSLLVRRNVQFHLDIIGDGDARAALEEKFRVGGLWDSVTFHGWKSRQEVEQFLFRSDMLVMTSDFEGTPIAMMEALAAGCGMVGTRVSGIEDYEHHAQAANCLLVYEVGDLEDAVNKIVALSVIPKAIRRKSARQLAEDEFSMAVCLNKYTNALKKINGNSETTVALNFGFMQKTVSVARALARYVKVRLAK